jgi:hypothetical protein
VLLSDRDPGPAELAHLAPERVVVGTIGLREPADLLGIEAAGDELACGRLDLALLVVEGKVNAASTSPELGEAEHALGDDVLEHVGGAALDRVRA